MIVNDVLGKIFFFLRLYLFFIIHFLNIYCDIFCEPSTVFVTEEVVLNCSSVNICNQC